MRTAQSLADVYCLLAVVVLLVELEDSVVTYSICKRRRCDGSSEYIAECHCTRLPGRFSSSYSSTRCAIVGDSMRLNCMDDEHEMLLQWWGLPQMQHGILRAEKPTTGSLGSLIVDAPIDS